MHTHIATAQTNQDQQNMLINLSFSNNAYNCYKPPKQHGSLWTLYSPTQLTLGTNGDISLTDILKYSYITYKNSIYKWTS